MEAKDTVMNDVMFNEIYENWDAWNTVGDLASLMIQVQAGISFKAGVKEERNKWANRGNGLLDNHPEANKFWMKLVDTMLISKPEEWGVDKPKK